MKPGEWAPGSNERTGRRPSAASIEKRAIRAERQADFAAKSGWIEVATLYRDLATALRALVA